MWELDHKEGWGSKNWCFQTVVLKKTLQSSMNYKEIKSANPKENQPWIPIGRSDGEAPILWLPDVKSQLIWNDPDAGKDWRQEEKDMPEDGWMASLTQWHEFEQTPGYGEGQGSLLCCSPWCHRVRHDWVTEQQCHIHSLGYILWEILPFLMKSRD